MTVTIVEVASGSDDGSHGSVTATTTSNVQTGDVLLIFSENDFGTLANLGTPSITGSPTPTLQLSTDATGVPGAGHQKIWTATTVQSGVHIITVTDGSGGDKGLDVIVLRGVNATIVDGTPAGTDSTGSSQTSQVAPSISPAQTNSMLFCYTHATGGASPASYTPPPGMTEQVDIKFGLNSRSIASLQLSASGATGTETFTAASSSPYMSASIAIRSAASGVNYTANPADNVGITDSAIGAFGKLANPADNVGITDSASGSILANTFTQNLSDTVGVFDTQNPMTVARQTSFDDPTGLTDTAGPGTGGAITGSPADEVFITDAILAIVGGPGGPGLIAQAADNLMNLSLLPVYNWIRLHVGPPGPTGNNNLAGNSVRQQVIWGNSIGGIAANVSALEWDNVQATETYTHFSAMSASIGGTPGFTGAISAPGVNLGDTFILDPNQLTAVLPVAS